MVMAGEASWRARAVCRSLDPETFLPTGEDGPAHDRAVARAKRVCRRCPVRQECLAWALDALPYGVAGGLSEDERRRTRQTTAQRARRATRRSVNPVRRGRSDRADVIAAGKALLADGTPREQVARFLGVSRRTVDRWAASALVCLVPGGGR